MKKQVLIDLLREAVKTEESATQIYAKHLSAIVSRSGLPAAEIARIRTSLQFLIDSNRKHKRELLSLIERIEGENIDVY